MVIRAIIMQNNLFNVKNKHILCKITKMTSIIFNNKISRSELGNGYVQIQNVFAFHIKQVNMIVRAMTKQYNLFNVKNRHICAKSQKYYL
jgi:hypothetical protein